MSTRRPRRGEDRLPPHDLYAERYVLGSMMLKNDVIPRVVTQLFIGSFYLQSHQDIYHAIHRLHKRGAAGNIDVRAVHDETVKMDRDDMTGGVDYLNRIVDVVADPEAVDIYAADVSENYMKRALIYSCHDVMRACYKNEASIQDLVAMAKSGVELIESRIGKGVGKCKEK